MESLTQADYRRYAADPLSFFDDLAIPSAQGVELFRTVMAPHQRAWFEAIAPSLQAVAIGETPEHTRYWSERTKGASKDSDCACVLVWLLTFGQYKLDCVVGAADRDQAAELHKAMQDVIRYNRPLGGLLATQQHAVANKRTHSIVNVVAADVAGSHGARPDITILNELSHVTKQEFAENLLDNATKKPKGLVVVMTNAGFIGSWQATWRQLAQESPRWHFDSFTRPAPWLTDEAIEEARRRNSKARFDRLFYGQWVNQSGDALDADDIAAAVDDELTPHMWAKLGFAYVAGLDLGIRHDHSAFVVLAIDRRTQRLQLAEAKSWDPHATGGQVDLMAVERHIVDASKRFNLLHIGFDPYQAELLAQRAELQGAKMQPMQFVGANLNLMASTMLDVFRSRRLMMYDHPALTADLGRLTIVEKSYGYRLDAIRDESGHADLATALAIALPIAVEEAGKVPVQAGSMFDIDQRSPYLQAIAESDRHVRDWQAEQLELAEGCGDESQAMWRAIAQRLGGL